MYARRLSGGGYGYGQCDNPCQGEIRVLFWNTNNQCAREMACFASSVGIIELGTIDNSIARINIFSSDTPVNIPVVSLDVANDRPSSSLLSIYVTPDNILEPGLFVPPSTRRISGRIRRIQRARSARRSAGRTGGETRRRTGANGRPGTGRSPAYVAACGRGRPRPARRRPGPPRGGVGQPAAGRAGRDRRCTRHGYSRPLTPPDARQNRRNPQPRDAAAHRRPFRRRQRRHGSFPPDSPT